MADSMARGCDWENPFFTVYMNSSDGKKCEMCNKQVDDKNLYKRNRQRVCKECFHKEN